MDQELTAIIKFLQDFVRIPSVNPEQDPQYEGEAALAHHLANVFRDLGGECVFDEVVVGRPNLYVLWRSPEVSRWIGVEVHMDTVQTIGMYPYDAFCGTLKDGKVHGRGTCDTKATLAVLAVLMQRAKSGQHRLPFNFILCCSVGEETTTLGADHFVKWLQKNKITLDELIVAEPTSCRPVHGHKGHARIKFNIHGVSGHSSAPSKSKSALLAGCRLVAALQEEAERLEKDPEFEGPLGRPTLAPTIFTCGSGANVIPALGSITVDYRITNEQPSDVRDRLALLANATAVNYNQHCERIETTTLSLKGAFYQPPSSSLVRRFAEITGLEPNVVAFGTNAPAYTPNTVRELLVFGPGDIAQAHNLDEWITTEQLSKARDVYSAWLGL